MFDKDFIGEITSVSGQSYAGNTSKDKINNNGFTRIKLKCANLDYDSMTEFDPNIPCTLLNIQPIPFKSIQWNFTQRFRMGLNITLHATEEELEGMTGVPKYEFINIKIKSIDIKIMDEKIPVYEFTLDIPHSNIHIDMLLRYKNVNLDFSFKSFETEDYLAKKVREDEAAALVEDQKLFDKISDLADDSITR